MPLLAATVPDGVKLSPNQEIVRSGGQEPTSIDPQLIQEDAGWIRAFDLFEGLYSQDPEGNLEPGVATSYNVNEDNTVYRFNLRKDAKWSNNEPVTAHDFVYGFQRAVDPKTSSPYSWYMQIPSIVNADKIINGKLAPSELGVKALDDYTFQVTLERPVPYFMKMITYPTMFPAPKKTIDKWGDDWTKPEHIVSNGAYKLKIWNINEKMVLERNPLYWNNVKTVIDKVTYLPIPLSSAQFKRYQAGEMDVAGFPLDHFKKIKQDLPNEVRIDPMLGIYYYIFNTNIAPFNDVRVRKALSYSINRDIITKYVLGTGQLPAYGFAPEAVSGYTPPKLDYSTWTQKERDEKAKALLAEAGYSDSNPLNFTLLYNTNELHKKLAIAIAAMWKKTLGVTVTLENQEWKTALSTMSSGNFQVGRYAWISDYNEASSTLDVLTSEHGNNYGHYKRQAYDNLMNQSRTMKDPSKVYQEAEKLAIQEDMAVAPIYQYTSAAVVKPYVGGYEPNSQAVVYTRNLYIKAH
ncbi:ABC transporter substrate-binding protein [Marinomonas sp. THO17]